MLIVGKRRDVALDRRGEAHVEYLVHNKCFKRGQIKEALIGQIQQIKIS